MSAPMSIQSLKDRAVGTPVVLECLRHNLVLSLVHLSLLFADRRLNSKSSTLPKKNPRGTGVARL
jgi:hypothetical protein